MHVAIIRLCVKEMVGQESIDILAYCEGIGGLNLLKELCDVGSI